MDTNNVRAKMEGDKMKTECETEALLIDAEGVQKMLGISRTHFFRLNASGRIPKALRLGRSTRWRVQELRDWISAGMPARVRWEWKAKA